MSEYIKTLVLSPTTNPARARVAFTGIAILLGLAVGGLVFFVPPLYILFLVGGLAFIYLLFVRIEIAIILALFLQNILGQFNYLGGGTPFHPNGIMGVAIIIGALFYFMLNKVEISRFRKSELFLIFFITCVLSTLVLSGGYFMESFTVMMRLTTALSIYAVLLFKLDSIKKIKWVLGAVIAAQVYPTISGLFSYAGRTGLSFTSETFRLGNSGVGVYLAMILIVCVVFLLDAKTGQARFLWGGLAALYALGLFFSFGRAGWISFIAALFVIGRIRHKWLLIVTPLLVALALLLVPAISQRFSDISPTRLDTGSSTFAGRVELWRAALDIYSSRPVFGVGVGIGRYLVGEYRNQYSWMIHNDYVSVLLETGLVGFVLFILWHGQWLTSLLGIYRKSEHPFDKTMALGVFAMLVVSLIARFTDNILLDSYDMYPLCALVATALALHRIRSKTPFGVNSHVE